MDVIKMEPESDSDTEPTLIEFESVNIKQEDPLVPLCTMKIALKVSCHVCVTERNEMTG
jgi:hypothetical protein